MTKWELKSKTVGIMESTLLAPKVDPFRVHTQKDKDGRSAWEYLKALADEGWELVSVTPITGYAGSGVALTAHLMYTFRRTNHD